MGLVSIVGRESYFYIFHFKFLEVLMHIYIEEPWVVDGALGSRTLETKPSD